MALHREPYAIIEPNRMGHLLITWPGLAIYEPDEEPIPVELYVQGDTDIQAILDCLPKKTAAELEKGWTVRTYRLPSDYIPEVL